MLVHEDMGMMQGVTVVWKRRPCGWWMARRWRRAVFSRFKFAVRRPPWGGPAAAAVTA